MSKRLQVVRLEPDAVSIVDMVNGDRVVTVEDEQFARSLADFGNFFFKLRYADRLKALRANERALAAIKESNDGN